MFCGHGCPAKAPEIDLTPGVTHAAKPRVGLGCRYITRLLWIGLVFLSIASAGERIAYGSESVECDLRFLWGSTSGRSLAGTISIDSGILRPGRNLSLQTDSVGRVRASSLRQLQIIPHSQSTFGGFDFSITATLKSVLTIQAEDPLTGESVQHSASVSDLLHGSWIQPLDEAGGRVAIQRQAYDRLRVESGNPTNIFRPTEAWSFQVAGYRTGLAAGEYTLLVGLENGEEVERRTVEVDENGSFSVALFQTTTPATEGGHQLVLRLYRKRFLDSLLQNKALLERRVDFVVLDDTTSPTQIASWKPLAEINALEASQPGSLAWLAPTEVRNVLANPTVTEVTARLNYYNPLAGTFAVPQSYGELSARTMPEAAQREAGQRDCLAIAPGSWLAIPLEHLEPGVPHRLRIRYPTDQPMKLAISVRQADPKAAPQNIDTAVHVGSRSSEADAAIYEHDVMFWPQGDQSFAVLANADTLWEASVAAVTVEVAEFSLSEATPAGAAGQERNVGLYLDRPMLADAFAAPRQLDPSVGREYESWDTWFSAAQRLGHVMSWNHANTVFVKVFAQGGGIFPSDILEPTTRFDGGAFFTDSRSPKAKDIVELLLRDADRNARRVVLALNLNTELPRLAQLRESQDTSGAAASILQLPVTGSDKDSTDRIPQVPHYNPLGAEVAAEITAVIQEISTRYAHHDSFAGIAIELDRNSQLVFAGDKWGYDARAVSGFQSAMGARLPESESLVEVFGQTAIRQQFLKWRAAELSKLFGSLASTVTRLKPTAHLYITPARIWELPPGSADFFEPGAVLRNPQSLLLACGIDPQSLAKQPGVRLVGGAWPHDTNTVDSTQWLLNDSSLNCLQNIPQQVDHTLAIQQATSRIAIKMPAEAGGETTAWSYPVVSGHGRHGIRDIIAAIHRSDATELVAGGWSPRQGHGEAMRSVFATLKALPPVALQTDNSQPEQTNICVRTGSHHGSTFVQLVNNAAWPEQVSLSLTYPEAAQVSELGPQTERLNIPANTRQLVPDLHTWVVKLQPYDMAAFEIASPAATLQAYQRSGDRQAQERIQQEVEELDDIITRAGDSSQHRVLANLGGDFEDWTDAENPVSWTLSSLPKVDIRSSKEFPHSGRRSLVITNQGRSDTSAWIQSQAFAPPTTGRLMVSAWVRAAATSDRLLVRLSVSGRTRAGQTYERSQMFGALSPGGNRLPIDWGRVPIQLYTGDVPVEQLDSLHVSLELIGPGRVWLDDVEVFEMILQPDERNHLRGQVLVARERLAKGNPYAAELLLQGHWGQYIRGIQHRDAAAQLSRPPTGTDLGPFTHGPSSRSASSWNNTTPVFQKWRESIRQRWQR